MRSMLTLGLLGLGALALAGCQQDEHQHADAAVSDKAVTCAKCQVTWVQVPVSAGKGRIYAYSGKQSHECPDCKSAVESYFATGKLEHTCKSCGADALNVCERH